MCSQYVYLTLIIYIPYLTVAVVTLVNDGIDEGALKGDAQRGHQLVDLKQPDTMKM